MRRVGFAFLLLFALAAVGQNIPIAYVSRPLSPATVPPDSQGFTLSPHCPLRLEWFATIATGNRASIQQTLNQSC
jgi:hypothetical protein